MIGATVYDEVLDEGATAPPRRMVAEALREFRPVSTSRPDAERAARGLRAGAPPTGPTEIVSVHLSGEMSGTFESAQLAAARRAGARCTRSTAGRSGWRPGTPRCRPPTSLDAGGSARRGGRGRPRAGRAGDVAVLRRHAGVPAPRRPDRRRRRALRRRAGGQAAAADRGRQGRQPRAGAHVGPGARPAGGRWSSRRRATQPVDVCVAHLASPDRAEQLAERLADGSPTTSAGREVWCGELGAVLGAHVGPGMVAVCVAPRS